MKNLLCLIVGHRWLIKRQTERFNRNKTIRTKVQEIQCVRCGLKRR